MKRFLFWHSSFPASPATTCPWPSASFGLENSPFGSLIHVVFVNMNNFFLFVIDGSFNFG